MACWAYWQLCEVMEDHGGTMEYERKDRPPHGAWVMRWKGKEVVCYSTGDRNLRDLDQFYEPKPGQRNPRRGTTMPTN